MSWLQLTAGLLLPWWAGYEILRRFGTGTGAARRMRQVGNGFFIGYALMVLLVRLDTALTGGVTWTHVALALGLVVLLARFAWPVQVTDTPTPPPAPVFGPLQKALVAVLSCWLLAHLWFNWVEIVATPVFPWDAWAVWVFRAKAWFAHAGLFEFLSVDDWLNTTAANAYAATALHYPWFVSIVPFWAAMSMNTWHETLVGLPVALLGPALALAFYGQLRSHGLQPLGSLVFTWFLVSTPLLAVHLSLAGYADIWMAGFVGLGFIGVLRYLLEGQRRQLLLGLVLLAVGTTIKLEGLVWLLAAGMTWVLARTPKRWLLAGLGLLALLVAMAALTGWWAVDLPVLGTIGIRDGMLHLPYLGRHELLVYDLRWAYWDNAFRRGSWHLAWLLALLAAAAAMWRGRGLRPVWAFLVSMAAVQALIFVFTTQGEWAQDYTAINRLPLQVYPAVLFAIGACWHGLANPGLPRPRVTRIAGVMLLAGVVALSAGLWLAKRSGEGMPAEPIAFGPERLTFVLGGGEWQDVESLRIDRFEQGVALLSTGPVSIDASRHYLLQLDIDYDWSVDWPGQAPAFFWRRADQPQVVSRYTLRDDEVFDLSDSDDWQGTIIEAGFVVLENQGQTAVLTDAALTGPEPLATWLVFEPWTQRSANVVMGGADAQRPPLTLLVTVWVLLSLAWVGLAARRGGRDAGTAVLLVVLLGWMVLDARWTHNRLEQHQRSWHALRTTTVAERIARSESAMFHTWIMGLRERHFGTAPRRILLVLGPGIHRFHARRTKYELLPHSATVIHNLPRPNELESVDFVVYMGDFRPLLAPEEDSRRRKARLNWLEIPEHLKPRLELLEMDEMGTLMRVRPPETPPGG